MEIVLFNQARLFLSDRMMILQSVLGQESMHNFHDFFNQQLGMLAGRGVKVFSASIVLCDHGKMADLWKQMSAQDQISIPCSYEIYFHHHEERCSKFNFHHITAIEFEQFLDHLSCFVALYLPDVITDMTQTPMILSRPVHKARGVNKPLRPA